MSDDHRCPLCGGPADIVGKAGGLTSKQAKVLDFIRSYIAENNGASPSYEDIKTGVGAASKNGVHGTVMILKKKGFIETGSRYRSIELVEYRAK